MKDDTPMYDPNEANYVEQERYHEGYHDRNSRNSYSYSSPSQTHHYPQSQPRNRLPHPSQYFKRRKTSTKEMMREWMASQTEANERMKNQSSESLPHTTKPKSRHEIVYKSPSIRKENDKGY
ncbi:hypothetical protein Tco_0255300 [Tanacetum coccineum]